MDTPKQTITAVGKLSHSDGEGGLYGSYVPVTLNCGHEKRMNPIYTYKVGGVLSCYDCAKKNAEVK